MTPHTLIAIVVSCAIAGYGGYKNNNRLFAAGIALVMLVALV